MKNKIKIKIKNKGLPAQSGFTLVELLIAISLFIVVVTISIGALLSVFDANRKAQSSKTVVDNLNLGIENMARTVRFGSNYYCGISTDNTEPIETNDNLNGCDSVSVTFKGNRIIYKLSDDGKAIQRKEGNGDYENITSSETVIQRLKFYVFGSSTSDANQPYIVAVIKGYSGTKLTSQTEFSIETLMSQRSLGLDL